MSVVTGAKDSLESTQPGSHKRKRIDHVEELEIDVNAAEPPSKKQLRKAKKSKSTPREEAIQAASPSGAGDATNNVTKHTTTTSGNPGRGQFGIWIGNLSFTTTKEELAKFITGDLDHPIEHTDVTRIHLPHGPTRAGKPQNKGFAYIDFSNVVALNHALQLSEKLFGGRRVLIKDAKNFDGRPVSKEDVAAGKAPSRRIFVGNLSFETTSEMLESHFGVCGKIQKTQVATFEDSGKCKGYAWIEFEQLSSAQSAMRGWVEQAVDGSTRQSKQRIWLKKMEGRQLRMEFAEDATTRYNKRYGKDGKGKQMKVEEGPKQQQPPIEEVDGEQSTSHIHQPRQKDAYMPKRSRQGYDQEVVQRMTGAIREGQGQKVVFE